MSTRQLTHEVEPPDPLVSLCSEMVGWSVKKESRSNLSLVSGCKRKFGVFRRHSGSTCGFNRPSNLLPYLVCPLLNLGILTASATITFLSVHHLREAEPMRCLSFTPMSVLECWKAYWDPHRFFETHTLTHLTSLECFVHVVEVGKMTKYV